MFFVRSFFAKNFFCDSSESLMIQKILIFRGFRFFLYVTVAFLFFLFLLFIIFFTGFADSSVCILLKSSYFTKGFNMGINPAQNKVVPVALDDSLYQLIETQAQLAGETLETFILNRLNDSIEAWTDYCSAVSMLNSEEKEHFHIRVTD